MQRISTFSFLVMSAVIAAIVCAEDTPPELPKSPAAVTAKKEFDQRVTWAKAERDQAVKQLDAKFANKVAEAQKDYLLKLRAAMDIALKAKDLQEANKIDVLIKSAKPDPDAGKAGESEASKERTTIDGTWQVRYTNGATRTYAIGRDGFVQFREEGKRARMTKDGDYWLIDWPDGKGERLMFAGKAMMVEYYDRAAERTSQAPRLMGTATRSE